MSVQLSTLRKVWVGVINFNPYVKNHFFLCKFVVREPNLPYDHVNPTTTTEAHTKTFSSTGTCYAFVTGTPSGS